MAAERVGRTYRQDFSQLARRYLLAGTPNDCARRRDEYVDAGVDVVLLRITCPKAEAEDMMRLISEEFVPALP